jgi:hypothetical protein
MQDQPVTQTIYLHIGTQKTGTTTLQQVGKRNREVLAARGVLYPASPGEINHTGLAIYASGGQRCLDLASEAGLRSPADIAAYQEKLPGLLRQEIAASGAQKVWLSNEHLSSRVRDLPQLAQLAAMLRGLAREVKIIIYLRHQPEYYLSTYSMVIKAGSEKETRVPASEREYYYNYDKMLNVWADAFGEDAILVRVFERAALINGDVVDDIFGLMGVDRAGLSIPEALNQSLDARSLQFLQLFRRSVPRYRDGVLNPEHGDVVRALEALPPGPKYRVSAEVMQRIADMFAASNARVARRFLHRDNGKLFAETVYRDAGDIPALSAGDAVDIAAHLWRWKHRQIAELRQARAKPRRAGETAGVEASDSGGEA